MIPCHSPARPRRATKHTHASALTAAVLAVGLVPVSAAFAAPIKVTATLNGAAEVPAADPDGTGGFIAAIDPETNDFCYSLWGDNISRPTMAHVHKGAAGTNGPPVITLDMTGKKDDACLAIDKDKLLPIVDNLGDYYVNIHTAEYPSGAIRGQLAKQ